MKTTQKLFAGFAALLAFACLVAPPRASAIDPAAKSGFTPISSGAGPPTGVPSLTNQDSNWFYWDTTGKTLYGFSGGSWRAVGAVTGAAGGDLSGNYPNPTVATVGGVTAVTIATNLPSASQKSALAGTSGVPSGANKYITDADPRVAAFVGDSGSGGSAGLVPAPASGDATKFLRGDGSFQTITIPPGNPFSDASALVKNSSDATKLAIFSAASITHATTRTYVLPDVAGATLATIDGAQTFTSATWNATPIAAAYVGDLSATYETLAHRAAASGYASLNGSSLVVQDPANATATPTAGKIVKGDGSGTVNAWVTSLAASTLTSGQVSLAQGGLAVDASSVAAHAFFGRSSSSSGAPSFATLATGDVPSLDFAKITTGIVPLAQGGTNADNTSISAHAFFGRSAGTTGSAAFATLATGDVPDLSATYQARTERGAASGYATLDAGSLVVQNPTNATATPTASKIVIADGSGKVDGWVTSGAAAGTPSLRALGSTSTTAAAGNDSRLSDSRAPNGSASGDLSGSYPGPSVVAINGTSVTSVAAHKFYGRSAGTTGAADFSVLASGDVPSLDFAKITTGIVPLAQGGTAVDNTAVAAHAFFGRSAGTTGSSAFSTLASGDIPVLSDAGALLYSATAPTAKAQFSVNASVPSITTTINLPTGGPFTLATTDGGQTFTSGTWNGDAIAAAYVGNLPASQITSGQLALAQGGLAVDASSVAAHKFFGRSSGSSGAPAFAVLATGDVPDLSATYQVVSEKAVASGYASLNASTLVVQNPANATATPTASKIVIADGSGKVTAWVSNMVGDSGSGGTAGLVPAPGSGDAAAGKFLKADGTFAVPSAGSSAPFSDAAAIAKNASDATRLAILDCSLIATATTRTFKFPNIDAKTFATIDGGQTFTSATWNGTAIGQVYGGTGLDTSTVTDGQLLIGNTTGNAWARAALTGTSNQVTVTNGHGTITLATPQSIATSSSPQFASLGLGTAAVSNQTLTTSASYTVTTTSVNDVSFSPTWADGGTTSTATVRGIFVHPTVNFTAASKTGFYEAITANVVETSVPTGATNLLLALRGGSAGTTDRFIVSATGAVNTGIWQGTSVSPQYGGTGLSNANPLPGYLLIGNNTGYTLAPITGTTSQITVTNGNGSITLSTPQNIDTAANVRFGSLGLNAAATGTAGVINCGEVRGNTTLSVDAADASGSNAAGNDVTVHTGSGTGNNNNQGNIRLQTPLFGASSSSTNAQNDRVLIAQTSAGSTTSATVNTFCQAALATSGSAATYYCIYHVTLRDNSSPVNVDANFQVFAVNVKNHNGTLTVGTVTTITTGTAVNDSGSLGIGTATVTASGTTISFKCTPTWTTIVPTNVIIQYDIFSFGGPTTLTPQ